MAKRPAVNECFLGSAQGTLEWGAGFGTLVGIVDVDFDTPERIPRLGTKRFQMASRRKAVG